MGMLGGEDLEGRLGGEDLGGRLGGEDLGGRLGGEDPGGRLPQESCSEIVPMSQNATKISHLYKVSAAGEAIRSD